MNAGASTATNLTASGTLGVAGLSTLAGVKAATSKCLGRTPNKLTNAMATIEALKQLRA
ncbi:MAG: hypothetical protein AAB621_00320 [Patescibacteria group bacterium]